MEKTFEQLVVSDVMTVGVISCLPETPLRTVARLMAAHRVHAVFVYGEGDETSAAAWGLVSDLDLVSAAWVGVDARTASDSAVAPLVTVTGDDGLEHAAQLMAENGVSHLAVLDPETKRPVGVVSTLDIADAVAHHPRDARLLDLRRYAVAPSRAGETSSQT